MPDITPTESIRKSVEAISVCVDTIPDGFVPINTVVDGYLSDKTAPLLSGRDVFICLANLWNDEERLSAFFRAIENLIPVCQSNGEKTIDTIDLLSSTIGGIIDPVYASLIASIIYLQVHVKKRMNQSNYIDILETPLFMANHFADILCDPEKDADSIVTVIDIMNHLSAEFLPHYCPILGYCGEQFTFLNAVLIEDLRAMVIIDVITMMKDNTPVKRCRNCGRYFIPSSRSDEIYCNAIQPNGRSCKEIGYDIKIKGNEILSTYRKIYKTQNARKQRNSHKAGIEARFKKWTVFAKTKLLECQSGEITLDDMATMISSDTWMHE